MGPEGEWAVGEVQEEVVVEKGDWGGGRGGGSACVGEDDQEQEKKTWQLRGRGVVEDGLNADRCSAYEVNCGQTSAKKVGNVGSDQ